MQLKPSYRSNRAMAFSRSRRFAARPSKGIMSSNTQDLVHHRRLVRLRPRLRRRYALAQGDAVVATARIAPGWRPGAQAPDRVLALALDVDRSGAAAGGGRAAVARFGRIDVLVNNAGYGIVGAVEETPEAELRAQMETNFFGAVAVIRAALPVLRAQRAARSSTSPAWAASCPSPASAPIPPRNSRSRACRRRWRRNWRRSASRC
jgi:hypothetical protein